MNQQPPQGGYGVSQSSMGYGPQAYGPPPGYGPQGVPVIATKTNVIAMVGFWLTIASYLTCGVTAIPGLICSIKGMKTEPKGWAVAGICLGIPGTIWCLCWVGFWALSLFGMAGTAALGTAAAH